MKENIKKAIKDLYDKFKSYRKVAKLMRVSSTFVFNYLNHPKTTKEKKKKGPKYLLKERDIRHLKRIMLKNRILSARRIYNILKFPISYSSLLRYIKKIGFIQKRISKKPFITNKTKNKRLTFACNTIHHPDLPSLLIFSDEKRFYLEGLNYNSKIWVHKDEKQPKKSIIIPKNFEKNSILIWGAVSVHGGVYLELCKNTIKSEDYIQILNNFLPKAINLFGGNRFLLIEDNAKPHISKMSNKFKQKKKIYGVDWPPSSPDINIIENVWKMMSDKVYEFNKCYNSKKELWCSVEYAWKTLNWEKVKEMILKWDDRLRAVIDKQGDLIN